MLTTSQRWLCVTSVSLMALGGFALLPAHSQRQNSSMESNLEQAKATLGPVDLQATLPAAEELPSFSRYHSTSRQTLTPKPEQLPNVGASMFATRDDDHLLLSVDVASTATVVEAQEMARRAINTPSGDMPQGTLSGRPVGQKVWQTLAPGQKPRGGSYQIIAYDGRTVVVVELMAPLQGYKEGRPVQSVLSVQDVQMAEDTASACLARVGYLGFTSQPALNASARQHFLTQRMALMHPAKRSPVHTAHK